MMSPESAERAVREMYEDERDKLGYPAIEHIARVAHAVDERMRFAGELRRHAAVVAWLHDAVEDGHMSFRQVYDEVDALVFRCMLLLTRDGKGTYMDYIRRLRDEPGDAGNVVRVVKGCDLDDNMSRPCPPEMTGMREPGGRYWRAKRALEGRA